MPSKEIANRRFVQFPGAWMWLSMKPGAKNAPLRSMTSVASSTYSSTSLAEPTKTISLPRTATASATSSSETIVCTCALVKTSVALSDLGLLPAGALPPHPVTPVATRPAAAAEPMTNERLLRPVLSMMFNRLSIRMWNAATAFRAHAAARPARPSRRGLSRVSRVRGARGI